MHPWRSMCIQCGLALMIAGGALAQAEEGAATANPSKTTQQRNPSKTREILEQIMVARLSRELALDESQTILLVRAFADYREQLHTLRRERQALVKSLDEKVRTNAEATDIKETLNALLGMDLVLAEKKAALFDDMSAQLTPWQQAQYYLFLGRFEGELRTLLQKARKNAKTGENRPGKKGGDAKRQSPPEEKE